MLIRLPLPSGWRKPCFWKTLVLSEGHPPFSSFSRRFLGSEERNPLFLRVECKSSFSPFFVKPTCFRWGTKTPFSKNTVFTALIPQCFWPRGRKLRPWSEKSSDQNSDHPRLCIYQGKEKLRPWSEFLGRENSDHGLSFPCFWSRSRRGGSQISELSFLSRLIADVW